MSAHCFFADWNFSDPIPDGLLNNMVDCVKINMKLSPIAFAELNHADIVVGWCYTTFSRLKDRNERKEAILKEAKGAPDPAKFEKICTYIMDNID